MLRRILFSQGGRCMPVRRCHAFPLLVCEDETITAIERDQLPGMFHL